VSPIDAATWPNVRDVAKQLDVSAVYAWRLIRLGRLQAVRTRNGFLIDPGSVAAFAAERIARQKRHSA
jgi:predicted site-specific integrase-resolvase